MACFGDADGCCLPDCGSTNNAMKGNQQQFYLRNTNRCMNGSNEKTKKKSTKEYGFFRQFNFWYVLSGSSGYKKHKVEYETIENYETVSQLENAFKQWHEKRSAVVYELFYFYRAIMSLQYVCAEGERKEKMQFFPH